MERNNKATVAVLSAQPTLVHAALIFDPALMYGHSLAGVLSAPNDNLPVTGEDLADVLRLTSL